jgi:hypothetical protein
MLIDGPTLSLAVGCADIEGALDTEGLLLGVDDNEGTVLIDGTTLSLAVGCADIEGALETEGNIEGDADWEGTLEGISDGISVGNDEMLGELEIDG